MGEVARMKLTQDNMRAMCDWVVADKTITSHRLNTYEGLEILIDITDEHLTVKENQWLIKYDDGTFAVATK
jgi:hypothetical protein